MKHQIVIPYSPCGGKFKNGTELRYVLKSLEKHFKGDYEVTVLGPKKPSWYEGAWLEQTQGRLKSALKLAADTFPNGFFWWYDDCVLIKDQTPEELKVTPARKAWGRIETSWGKKLEQIRVRLVEDGITPWDYSRPHGPYWFDKSMVDESFDDWKGMSGKFPFESWILSKRDWPRRFGVEAQYYGDFKNPPAEEKVFVNWCDRGMTPELIKWLDEQFPDASTNAEEQSGTVEQDVMPEDIHPKKPKKFLFTCHEGCDPRVWQWCGEGIRAFAKSNQAELIELPKCLDANPQWVLFDAFRESTKYAESDEFAWVDSDLVIAYPATDVWVEYPKKLHVCIHYGRYKNNLHGRTGLPMSFPNNCTGVVKWNRKEAELLADWYDKNKLRFPKSDGDQELLGVACYELGIEFSWFHRKMHVAGANPPPNTVFKHKGGPSKIRWIPRFLETNRQFGISPPSEFIWPSKPVMKTYRICRQGKDRLGETIVDPVFDTSKEVGTAKAHIRAMETVLQNDVFPCLVLEEDAAWLTNDPKLPETNEDWLFVGLSKYAIDPNEKVIKWTTPPVVRNGLIDMDGMLATHAIVYNNKAAAQRMLGFAMLSLLLGKPIDVAIALFCQKNKVSRKGLSNPWLYQLGYNQQNTKISINMINVEPTYDMSKYPLFPSEWAQMDDRHTYDLYSAACSDWEGSRIAVEIGSWKGRTTTALIEALNDGKLDHLHIIEVNPTPELKQVISCAKDASKITIHTTSSWDLTTIPSADFVFIDGDHRWPALADTLRALTWGAKVICMHDTQAFPRLKDCWGSWNASKLLKQHPDWEYTEDCEDREGEKTFRGFMVARRKQTKP
jgi:hypothetical protein